MYDLLALVVCIQYFSCELDASILLFPLLLKVINAVVKTNRSHQFTMPTGIR